jgi:HEAT repeat protein
MALHELAALKDEEYLVRRSAEEALGKIKSNTPDRE